MNLKWRYVGVMAVLVVGFAVLVGASGAPRSAATPDLGTNIAGASAGLRYPAEITWYAEQYGVSEEEAMRRSALQEQSHTVKRQLRDAAPDRLSAVWLEHEPEMRVVAWYTGPVDTLEAVSQIAANAPMPVEIRGDAPMTEAEFVSLAQRIRDDLSSEVGIAGISVEGARGVIHVELQPTSRYSGNEAELGGELSVRYGAAVEVTTLEDEAGDDTTYGGRPLSYAPYWPSQACTSGFSVSNDAGATGVITAGHCQSSPLTYWQTPGGSSFATTFVAESRGPYSDVQWSSVVGTEVGAFWNGSQYVFVFGSVDRVDQLGDSVCRYGQASNNLRCGSVISITYVPTWSDACNGSLCGASWIQVYGAATIGGDSGGPWFWINDAYGIVKGHAGGNGIYMAIDYAYYYLGVYVI